MVKTEVNSLQHYSVKDISLLLKVSRRSVYNMILRGEIKGVKIAEKWRFSVTDIEDYLEKQREIEYRRTVRGTYKIYQK